MIVLDASVVIAFLDHGDAHHSAVTALVLATGDHELGMSSLTLAEVLVQPILVGRNELTEDILRVLEMQELALPPVAAHRLAELRALTGLRLPDCCVLLAAQGAGAAVATFDRRLAAAAEGLGLRSVGIGAVGETGGG